MGQKVNSTIFKTQVLKHWKSKYIEKKANDLAYYNFRDLELQRFVGKVFEDNGLVTNNIKINYHGNLLNIFISYYYKIESEKQVVQNLKKKPVAVNAKVTQIYNPHKKSQLSRKTKICLKQLFYNRFIKSKKIIFKAVQIMCQGQRHYFKNKLNSSKNSSIIKKILRKALRRKLNNFSQLRFRMKFIKMINQRFVKYRFRKYFSGLKLSKKTSKARKFIRNLLKTFFRSRLVLIKKNSKILKYIKEQRQESLCNRVSFGETKKNSLKNQPIEFSSNSLALNGDFKLLLYKYLKQTNIKKLFLLAQSSLFHGADVKKIDSKSFKFYSSRVLNLETRICEKFRRKLRLFHVEMIKRSNSLKRRNIIKKINSVTLNSNIAKMKKNKWYKILKSNAFSIKRFPLSFIYLGYFFKRFLKRGFYSLMKCRSYIFRKNIKKLLFYNTFVCGKMPLISTRLVDLLLRRYMSKKSFYFKKFFFNVFNKFGETVATNQFLNKQNLIEKAFFSNMKLSENTCFIKSGKLPINALNFENFFDNGFVKMLHGVINAFTEKKFSIRITLKQLKSTSDIVEVLKQYNRANRQIRKKICRKTRSIYSSLKRSKSEMLRLKQDKFFSETFKSMIAVSRNQSSAFFLAKFVARHIQMKIRKKRHNYYFRFLQSFLTKFCSLKSQKLLRSDNSMGVKSVRIEVKGRLGKSNRAGKKIIIIGKGVQRTSLKSLVDYASTIAYSTNCTFGVKVWIQYYQDAQAVWSWKKIKDAIKKKNPKKKNHFFNSFKFGFRKCQFYKIKKKLFYKFYKTSNLLLRLNLRSFRVKQHNFSHINKKTKF